MKLYKETLFDRLRNRLPTSEARKAIRALKKAKYRLNIDYMTVKEMSELVHRYRSSARVACNAVREWQVRDAVQRMDAAFRARELELLRAQARDAIALYQDAKRDYIDIHRLAMSMEDVYIRPDYVLNPGNDDHADEAGEEGDIDSAA